VNGAICRPRAGERTRSFARSLAPSPVPYQSLALLKAALERVLKRERASEREGHANAPPLSAPSDAIYERVFEPYHALSLYCRATRASLFPLLFFFFLLSLSLCPFPFTAPRRQRRPSTLTVTEELFSKEREREREMEIDAEPKTDQVNIASGDEIPLPPSLIRESGSPFGHSAPRAESSLLEPRRDALTRALIPLSVANYHISAYRRCIFI